MSKQGAAERNKCGGERLRAGAEPKLKAATSSSLQLAHGPSRNKHTQWAAGSQRVQLQLPAQYLQRGGAGGAAVQVSTTPHNAPSARNTNFAACTALSSCLQPPEIVFCHFEAQGPEITCCARREMPLRSLRQVHSITVIAHMWQDLKAKQKEFGEVPCMVSLVYPIIPSIWLVLSSGQKMWLSRGVSSKVHP